MQFEPTPLDGLHVVHAEPRTDDRGLFARIWCVDELAEAGLDPTAVQLNMSTNERAGTLRGLHFQRAPHEENKLLRCVRGAVWDVAVDIRPDSPTYLEWFGVELTEENRRAVFVPGGFAHGYLALTDGATVIYFSSERYTPGVEGGLRWDDPAVGIEWPMQPTEISEKDLAWPDWVDPAG